MSRKRNYIVILILSVSMMLASETMAQKKALSEITIKVEHQQGELRDLVSELEGNTGFTFAYLDESLQHKPISLGQPSWQMDALLKEISVQAKVSLRRINGSIAITSETDDMTPHVEEKVMQWSISGSVLGQSDAGMPYANVLLLNARDSTVARGVVTDEQGVYSISHVDPGKYFIQTFTVGFTKNNSQAFHVDDNLSLSPIQLEESIRELEAVVIRADKPLFEQKVDRLIVNVESSPVMTGSTAWEVLGLIPGLAYSAGGGAVKINGKSGAMLMINGKLNRMSGDAMQNYLQSMPSENIERIELITAPPSKFDADGNGGFINIVLKKNDTKGIHGSVNLMTGFGRKEKMLINTSINCRTQKLNVFGNLSYNRDQVSWFRDLDKEIQNPEYQLTSTSTTNRLGGYDIAAARLGLDYYLNDKTTFGILGDFYVRDYKAHMIVSSYYDFEPGVDTLSKSIRRNLDMKIQSLLNFNILHHFDATQSIEINIDYLDFRNDQNDQYDNEYFPQNGKDVFSEDLLVARDFPVRFWVGAMDYQSRPNEKALFEAGVKATLNKLANDVATNRMSGEVFINDPDFTFFTTMQEYILAAYGSVSTSFGKTTFKSGLRYEHTQSSIWDQTELPLVKRSYGSFFPNVFLSRKMSAKSSLNVSYISRISRPGFYELSPGQKFVEPRLFRTGNTQLMPSKIHTLQGSWTLNRFIVSVEYNQILDDIAYVPIRQGASDWVVISNINLDKSELLGMRFSFLVIICDWWDMNSNLGFYNKRVTGSYLTDAQELSTNFGIGYVTNSFKIGHEFMAELSGNYRSGNILGFREGGPVGQIALGIKKNLGESGGTISLSMSDVFRTAIQRSEIAIPSRDMVIRTVNDFDTRVFRISYTNTFGNNKIKSRSKRKGGAEEELKRL